MKRIYTALLAAIGVHQHLSAEQKNDIDHAVFQTAPGAAVASGARVGGLPLSDWLVVASIGFIILQAAFLVWKWRRAARRDRERTSQRTDWGEMGADE